jgi:hypothetical protein
VKAPRTALLLIGSPKPKASTSASLGGYLAEELEELGVQAKSLKLTTTLRTEEAMEGLHAAVAEADLVILSFPLYWDSLPAHVTRALELIAARRATAPDAASLGAGLAIDAAHSSPPAKLPTLAAICQCGFPEVHQTEVALQICRNFAQRAGFAWAGGLAMGRGGMIDEAPLHKIAGRIRPVVQALDLSAAALAAGRPLPDEAVQLMAKPTFPAFAYRLTANWGWRRKHKEEGASTPLDARPFA